jgi:hypothetical protein
MSKASWPVSGAVPGVERQPLKKLEPDATAHYALDLWVERWRRREEVGSSILSPPTIPGQLADKISSPTRESIAKPGERMWLDLLVASGIGLPAMVYGSVLFLNYMQ